MWKCRMTRTHLLLPSWTKTDCSKLNNEMLTILMTNQPAMNYLTCECVWCALIRRDFQCCGVLIKITELSKKGDVDVAVRFPNDYEEEQTPDLVNDVVAFALSIYKYETLKKGESKDFEKQYCHANVECILKSKKVTGYYLCFHADLPEDKSDDEPSTPSVMD